MDVRIGMSMNINTSMFIHTCELCVQACFLRSTGAGPLVEGQGRFPVLTPQGMSVRGMRV